MIYVLQDVPLFWLSVLGGLLCFVCTSLGASFIFLFKNVKQKFLNALLAFAGGVMIASSFFSLINPAIESCEQNSLPAFLFISIGFFIGGTFIILSSKILDRYFSNNKFAKHVGFKRSVMLAGSMTLHNIPEGMAVGVAFGALSIGAPTEAIVSALMLAVGVGIQNIPEGASVSVPLRREGVRPGKAFLIGCASGVVELIFAPIAFLICHTLTNLLPFLLSFAAGTMIAVAVCELLPEAVAESKNRAILFLVMGFVAMAVLDLALG